MEITGKVTQVLERTTGQSKAGKDWQKQLFVVEYMDGQYAKSVCFTAFGKVVDAVPDVGDEVTVSFNVESRAFGEKWYTDVQAWKINVNAKGRERVAYDSEIENSKDSGSLPF